MLVAYLIVSFVISACLAPWLVLRAGYRGRPEALSRYRDHLANSAGPMMHQNARADEYRGAEGRTVFRVQIPNEESELPDHQIHVFEADGRREFDGVEAFLLRLGIIYAALTAPLWLIQAHILR